MKFCIDEDTKEQLEKCGNYIFERRSIGTWWFKIDLIEDLIRIMNLTHKILSFERDVMSGEPDLITLSIFEGY